jgi:cadmium resistance protein CadD (predicted permease)
LGRLEGVKNRQRGDSHEEAPADQGGPATGKVTTVTFANGGDNNGVYVPVFTTVGTSGTIVYSVVFLILVGVWCAAGRFFTTRPAIAKALSRWGHIVLPVVLITSACSSSSKAAPSACRRSGPCRWLVSTGGQP